MPQNAAGPGPLDTGAACYMFVSALTDVDTSARDQLGAIRRELNGTYKYVQFGASRTTNVTASLAAGDVACYIVASTTDAGRLTLVDSANSILGAGVVMGTVASTGGPYYGWIQVGGVSTLNQAIGGSSPVAGNALTTTSASAKTLTKRAAATDQLCGVLFDNGTSSTPVVSLTFPQ